LESRSFRFGPALGPSPPPPPHPYRHHPHHHHHHHHHHRQQEQQDGTLDGGHRHTLNHQEGNFYNFSLVCFEFTFYFLPSFLFFQLCFFSSFPWLDSSPSFRTSSWRVDAVF